jgi:hypothetical protein
MGVSPAQLLTHCRSRSLELLGRQLGLLVEKIDDSLFELADKAGSSTEQGEYFDAMRRLRLERDAVKESFQKRLTRAFDDLIGGRRAGHQVEAELDLGLVGHEDLERKLAMDGIAEKAERQHEDALFFLGRRLQTLSGRRESDEHPLRPRAIADAFRSSVEGLELGIKVELILYKLFDKHVAGELAPLYQDLNRYLAAQGVLPDLRREAPKLRRNAGPLRRRVPAAQAGDAPGGGGGGAEGAVLADAMAGGEIDPLLAVLQQVAGGGGGGGVPGVTVASEGQLLGVLSGLQQQPAYTIGGGDALDLRAGLMQGLGGLPGGGSGGVGGLHQGIIDIVSMLFDLIYEDASIAAPLKAEVARLQIPVLKAAILDRSFFSQRHHPARRLVNELAEFGVGFDASTHEGETLVQRVHGLIDRVLDEFENDLGVFDDALDELDGLLGEQSTRAEQTEEQTSRVARNEESLRIAEVVASESVRQILRGHQVPEPVVEFLHEQWQGLLVLVYHRLGGDSDQWTRVLNVASLLVWSVAPKLDAAQRAQLVQHLPGLQRALRDGMQRLSMPEEEQGVFMAYLAKLHAQQMRPSEPDARGPVTGAPVAAPVAAPGPAAPGPVADSPTPAVSPAEMPAEAAPAPTEPDGEAVAPVESDGRNFMARKVEEIQGMLAEGRFLSQLAPAPGDAVDAADASEADSEGPSAAQPVATPDAARAGTPRPYEYDRVAESLEEGRWVEFADDTGPVHAKLSWKSLITGKYFFVNRQGFKVRELTVAELAQGLRAGEVRVLDERPVVDRAIERLAEKVGAVADGDSAA